ncbi:DNA N6-methyl adenine demethylase-like [Ctenocephalides felis]|uniref:DNA N6-methyl adenine demethylase-like n=1 Tax=Ctenocephalides felis TaxID=7515 RepID=UPI000E6E5625|nr:DNA N6-methyl adenine demethylase-like [Ctenocephalides felis]
MNSQHHNPTILPQLSFEMDTTDNQRLYTATELNSWGDYYTSSANAGTLLGPADSRERSSDNNAPQYRPWESVDGGPLPPGTPKEVLLRTGFSGVMGNSQPPPDLQQPVSKLPSFQSQFNAFQDAGMTPEPSLTTLTPVPVSPNSSTSPSGLSAPHLTPLSTAPVSTLTQITQLGTGSMTPAFHTIARGYPLVPAPVQAREVPAINQQYLDERHIQLYQPVFQQTGLVTVLKNEPAHFDLKLRQQENGYSSPHLITSVGPASSGDNRKKERRKARASSLESATSSHQSDDQVSSNVENETHSGQVAAVSSTASFKSPLHHGGLSTGNGTNGQGNGMGRMMDTDDLGPDKQVKKKRKRCGECVGCQRKDNCGDCAPCRNDKSHQICKQRRCEKLTEKKLVYGPDGNLIRQESRRGRGKGRGTGSYRGRKAALSHGLNTPLPTSLSTPPPPLSSTVSPAPASNSPAPPTTMKHDNSAVQQQQQQQQHQQQHNLQQQMQQQLQQQIQQQHHIDNQQQQQQQTLQQQQMPTPMAFYPTPTWGMPQPPDQAQAWQNQFIQQLPTQDYHQTAYTATPLYQTNGYVQNVAFETPSFYSAAQVCSRDMTN